MTGKSLFLNLRHRPFQVPLLAVEHYGDSIQDYDVDDDAEMQTVMAETLMLCGVGKPTLEDFRELAARLREFQDSASDGKQEAPKEAPKAKSLGTSFSEWVNKRKTEAILGAMTGYDIAKMKCLYCEVDFSDCQALIKDYIEGLYQMNLVNYENMMYAQGGSYKGDSGGGGARVMDAGSKDGMAAMAQFGVGGIAGDTGFTEGLGLVLE